jgi:hypothetical protein
MKPASEKPHMLRYAAAFVAATYAEVRLAPQALRALLLELFAKPFPIDHFYHLNGR